MYRRSVPGFDNMLCTVVHSWDVGKIVCLGVYSRDVGKTVCSGVYSGTVLTEKQEIVI